MTFFYEVSIILIQFILNIPSKGMIPVDISECLMWGGKEARLGFRHATNMCSRHSNQR